ncbi:uncharacterized protein PHALS_09299 [Plasmopara halstedii]|uniref:Uncharacterized protein n=1 Tax=Plasmopara halstedii TaxID=4781 RepID=A0A0P1AEL9_PLAHL|nr:uncharacterized protein PHALS_09299 [Plasmopara halstedii]CEG39246.1 hypothetical protein PHALS_09299 [Plasmopara halstedii]|eukprot:XP_024575615.1 hypothetical protein PHALS_09299 [Plasmopara halstedii]
MRSVRRTHTKLPAPAKKPSSKRNVRKLPPSGKKSSLKANIPRTTTPVNAALADPYLQLAIRTSASLKKQIKSGIEMDVAVGGSHTKNLVQHGFNRHEVEVILRTARLDHAKVQDLLKQYDTAVKKTSITAILDDVTEFNNRQSLSPDFLTKVEARAAKVIVNRVIDDPQRLHLNSEMPFYDEWNSGEDTGHL